MDHAGGIDLDLGRGSQSMEPLEIRLARASVLEAGNGGAILVVFRQP